MAYHDLSNDREPAGAPENTMAGAGDMPKVTETKVGLVLLREIEPGRWRVEWREALTRRRHRVILPATNFKDARKQAKAINDEIAVGKGFSGRLRGSTDHTVRDAVLEAVKHTDANERTRSDYLSRYNSFSDYLSECARGVFGWADVSEQVIANYIEHCRRQGVSHDTLRMRLFVLRLTSAYMAKTYPGQYRNVTADLKLRRHDPPRAELDAEEAILRPPQIRALLDWLYVHDRRVYVWAVLQVFGGMRLLECAYLREQDINAEAGTVTITESPAHKPKNRHSYRTIPLAPEALRALGDWLSGLKVRHELGYLFFRGKGTVGRAGAKSSQARAGVYTVAIVSRIWDDALGAARLDEKAKLEISPLFTPRRLRGSFVTAVRAAGADTAILQEYIGHAPATILVKHYDHVDLDRLRPVAALAQSLFGAQGALGGEKGGAVKTSGFGR